MLLVILDMRKTGVVAASSIAISIAAFMAPNALFGAGSGVMCTMEYQPVCAAHQVQCIKAPCYPVYQTYGNACTAGVAGSKVIHEGACLPQETGPITGPKADPTLGSIMIARVASRTGTTSTSTTALISLTASLASSGTSTVRLDTDWLQDLFQRCFDALKWIRARMLITGTE